MDPIIFRGLERLLIVSGAILTVFLGYALFRSLPYDRSANGKFVFPGGATVHLTRTGPGAFFAIFGASVLVFAIRAPLKFGPNGEFYLSPPPPPISSDFQQANVIKKAIQRTNKAAVYLTSAKLSSTDVQEAQTALRLLKLGLMELVWKTNWPPYDTFFDLVLKDKFPEHTNSHPTFIPALQLYESEEPL